MTDNNLNEKQTRFLDLLYSDGIPNDIIEKAKEIKEEAGYAENTSVYQLLRVLKDEIVKRNVDFMTIDSGSSINAIVDVRRNPTNPGAETVLKAANSLLEKSGLGKKETLEVEHKIPNGLVILPAKKS
jgi:hypothetical protein